MPTRLGNFCDRVIEAGWLLSLIIIPLFFNPHSERVFEADKAYILRSIVIIMLVAWIIKSIELGNIKQSFSRSPLLTLALLFGLSLFIASLFSPFRIISFKGYYLRDEGFYTFISYLIIFLLMWQGLKNREQVERLLTTMILVSFPISLYGIFQHFGLDPVRWKGSASIRVTTTLGGPIFAAAYLIMIVPLTISRIIQRIREPFSVAGYGLILTAQIACIIFTKSRGPLFGLLVGLGFFVLIIAIIRRIRWLFISVIAVTFLTILFFVLLNIPRSPIKSMRPYFGRLGQIRQETTSGSGKVRLLTYQGADSIIKANPWRLATGYGLESLFFLYYQHCPAEIALYEGEDVIPDHSHNETFDLLITGGIPALLLYLGIIVLVAYLVYKHLGLINTKKHRLTFAWLVGIGLVLGFVVTGIIGKGLTLIGLGIPIGLIMGLGAYLLIYEFILSKRSILPPESPKEIPYTSLLLIALLCGIIAHFAELQLGIGVTTTRLCFWVFLAVIGLTVIKKGTPRNNRDSFQSQTHLLKSQGKSATYLYFILYSIMGGLVISVLSFFLLRRKIILEGGAPINYFVLICVIVLLLQGFLIVKEVFRPASPAGRKISLGKYVTYYFLHLLLSICWGGLFMIILVSFIKERTAATTLLNLLYIWLGFNLVLLSIFLPKEKVSGRLARGFAQIIVYLIILVIGIAIINFTNLREAYADLFSRQGKNAMENKKYDLSVKAYQKSIELSPGTDYYYHRASVAYQMAGNYVEGERMLLEARKVMPDNLRHYFKLARLYLIWANNLKDAEQVNEKLELSLSVYRELDQLTPRNARVYREWAKILRRKKDYPAAIEKYQQLLDIIELKQSDEIYRIIGNIYKRDLKDSNKAIEAYEKAVEINPKLIRAYVSLGDLYYHQKRYEDCIRVNHILVKLESKQYLHRYHLAVVYRDVGKKELALKYAREALELAPPDAKKTVKDFSKGVEK